MIGSAIDTTNMQLFMPIAILGVNKCWKTSEASIGSNSDANNIQIYVAIAF